MTFEEAQPILAAILSARDETRPVAPADVTEAVFHGYVSACNAALSPLDLEIRSSRPQTTSPHRQPPVYAIVNATSDALTQIATTHSPDEIAFVKRLLDAMFETHNTRRAEVLALTSMQAINLHKASPRSRDSGIGAGGAGATETQGSSGASLTMAQAQKVLDDLVEEGWFEKSAKGFLSLSPRALMELRGWLIETYNEPTGGDDSDDEGVERVKMCEACREIVTVGQRCSNRDCRCRLHDACVRQFFRTLPGKRCPVCKAEWTEEDFVGERAAKPSNRNRTSAATAASSSRRTTMHTMDDDESE
ncbi:Non-structural maintenance of chromosomes element 1-like protein [Lasiodiplodia hormozganensis]|uniref:Non-structural maintenance of chromosomes element 1 homolog n=1 Tax=Lasiodiplodia hormozganensis TaxID=869390 RepID=A0AA39Z2T7_9PEZI|nr:Non-structural maintenance of chromosomes element 1-like protein [Lasiodiplodia hormozganensis]